ncbi:MarR family transcriptional regulator [uncultured Roseibium sp.]|uniref:MarR family winged helix-turn-helix transcriptional regulator n=1 Tax=uncultured Roseibium sp. TaxID=1936171 RepID=UPI00344D71CA
MNETTDQMSLLDAIDFGASDGTPKPKKTTRKEKTASSGETELPAPSGKSEDGAPSNKNSDVASGNKRKKRSVSEKAEKGTDIQSERVALDEMSPLTLDRFLCFALYSANHAMHGVYKNLLKEIGLTYPQYLAMTVLWETNNIPVGTITSKLQLDTNTLTPLLKRLEAMGLVTRTRNIKDERQVILKLTRKGRALQKKTEHFSQCVLSATNAQLDEIMDLQSRIMTLRDNLRNDGTTS